MSSVGNPNPWAPYDNYRDCSQGICSIYCPQFCYLIFPPPPPSDDDSTPFSPLIIAIIGVLASAFLLVSYYTVVTRYCKRRNARTAAAAGLQPPENPHDSSPDQWQVDQSGLDEAVIKKITVCKYVKGEGLIEGTDCAVCLSEFQENESLRLLPKCSHAFHLPCIDTWLRSQSNCPLCRANVVAVAHPVADASVTSNSYEIRRPEDLVLVVDDQERNCDEHMVVINDDDEVVVPKSPNQGNWGNESVGGDEEEGVEQYRRSISLGTFSSQRQLLISDILKFEEIDEYMQLENDRIWRGIGSSKEVGGLLRSPVAMKRSVSTDGFMFQVNDKGKNSIHSN